jgi:hypothetical protein
VDSEGLLGNGDAWVELTIDVILCLLQPPAERQCVAQSLYGQPLAVNPLQLAVAHRSFCLRLDTMGGKEVGPVVGRRGVTPVGQTPNHAFRSA